MHRATDDTLPDAPGAGLPQGAFIGRETFRELVRTALAEAARCRWRELILADADFHDWPLGERAVIESLTSWALSGGQRLTLLARRYDTVVRTQPRFVAWRRQWSHKIDARGLPGVDAQDVPCILWTPAWVLERQDVLRSRGFSGSEPERRRQLRETLEDWLTRSSTAFPADTLGL